MNLTPDPHGQAALMLCEGTLLLLIEKGIIDKNQAADVIEGIIEVKQEIAGVSESVVVSLASITLLRAVARSVSAATAGSAQTAKSEPDSAMGVSNEVRDIRPNQASPLPPVSS